MPAPTPVAAATGLSTFGVAALLLGVGLLLLRWHRRRSEYHRLLSSSSPPLSSYATSALPKVRTIPYAMQHRCLRPMKMRAVKASGRPYQSSYLQSLAVTLEKDERCWNPQLERGGEGSGSGGGVGGAAGGGGGGGGGSKGGGSNAYWAVFECVNHACSAPVTEVHIRQSGDSTHDIHSCDVQVASSRHGPWVHRREDSFVGIATGSSAHFQVLRLAAPTRARFWKISRITTLKGYQPNPRELRFYGGPGLCGCGTACCGMACCCV